MSDRSLKAAVCALLIIGAALFAIAVAVERHDTHTERAGHAQTQTRILLADADQGQGEHPLAAPTRTSGKATTAGEHPTTTERPATEIPAQRPAESDRETRQESAAQRASERGSERVFGINTESTPLVAAVVAVSLAFALAIWRRPRPLTLLAIIALGLGAAIFDIREVLHQIDESRTNLAVIAAIVALLHLAAATTATILARRLTSHRQPTAAAAHS